MYDQDAAGEAERRVAQLLATPLPEHKKWFWWVRAWGDMCPP